MAKKDENQYEIVMYKLLGMVLVGMFLSLAVGFVMGNTIGKINALDDIETPEYCWAQKQGKVLVVNCNEIDVSISSMCETLSEDVQENFKIVVVS